MCNKTTKVTHAGKLNFKNHFDHIRDVHSNAMLVREDRAAVMARNDGKAKHADGGSAAKRGRPAEGAVIDKKTLFRDEVDAVTSLVVMGALPINVVRNPGFLLYQSLHGAPTVSYSTVRRSITKMHEVNVIDPRNKLVAAMLLTETININGAAIQFAPKVNVIEDGWTASDGGKYMSVSLSGGVSILTAASLPPKTELRPSVVEIALQPQMVDVVGFYAADKMADQISEILATVPSCEAAGAAIVPGITPDRLLLFTSDTTSSQSAACDAEGWQVGGLVALEACGGAPEGIQFVPCFQHLDNLLAEDVEPLAEFKAAVNPAKELGTWVRASEKRWGPLVAEQTQMGISHPAKPLQDNPTRFLEGLLVSRRIVQLMPAFQAVVVRADAAVAAHGKHVMDAATLSSFKQKVAAAAAALPQLIGILTLFEDLMEVSALTGSNTRYTLPMRMPIFQRVLAAAALGKVSAIAAVQQVAVAMEKAAWQRLGTAAHFSLPARPAAAVKPTGKALILRIAWDETSNVAAYMDPASFATFEAMGGHFDDVTAYSVRYLKACVVHADDAANGGAGGAGAGGGGAPPQPAVAGGYATYALEVAAIKAWPSAGPFEAPDTKAARIAAGLEAARVKWKKAPPAAAAAAGVSVAQKLEDMLQDAFEKEAVTFKQMRDLYRVTVAGVDSWLGATAKFGTPLDKVEKAARYQFWPEQRATLPLHYFVARAVLGAQAASTVNERLHSVSGYICAGHRGAMKADMLEMLTLGKIFARKLINNSEELMRIEANARVSGNVDTAAMQDALGY